MPTVTWARLDPSRRAAVIEAAEAEFGAHGFSRGSLNVIARRAGVAKGSLFQYFADKRDLYAFIADVGSNLIHRKKVRRNGVALQAERPADEQKIEFITSTDLWFRPVQMVNAPDGCLYLCDMYREVIEHPWSLPENIKKLLDLNSGNDRGRIYRIVRGGFRCAPQVNLRDAESTGLVELLEHKNAWQRETAQQAAGRGMSASSPLLQALQSQIQSQGLARGADLEQAMRWQTAQGNAEQLMKGQQLMEQAYGARQAEDIARRKAQMDHVNALIQALSNLSAWVNHARSE